MINLAKSWRPLAWASAFLLFSPIVALLIEALKQGSPIFAHLYHTVLFDYVKNSLILLAGVCGLAMIWGVPSAWLVARYEFFGRKWLRWALLLPMALPAYLVAYVYTDVLDYAGPVQSAIRAWFGYASARDYWFVDMRTMGGAIFVLSLVFAPYVYWLTSLNFQSQSQSLFEAARLLGQKEWQIFYKVALPLARPAIAVGCTLVGMETLADYGTVAYFSIWHITTAIYDTWLGHGDLSAAAKLSSLLLLFVVVLISLEKYNRRKMRLYSERTTPLLRVHLRGWRAILAALWCGFIVMVGFLLPAGWLVYSGIRYFDKTDWGKFAQMTWHSVSVALGVALMALVVALVVEFYARKQVNRYTFPRRLASLGYAVPGTVLAIGVLIVTTTIDHGLNALTASWGFGNIGLLLSGTLFAMGFAFLCRFAAIAIGSVEAGMGKIPISLDQTAFMHGYNHGQTARVVWLPLLRGSLLTAFVLVFLESMKELSAALLLRPFNVNTLATHIFEYMSAEMFEVAALPALLLVVVGLPPVILLTLSMDNKQ